MIRKIVQIDEEKCDGCGLCIPNCVEGALQVINGKAKLVKDTYCDGLGACLGHCPQDAIQIIEREAPDFDEASAMSHAKETGFEVAPHLNNTQKNPPAPCGCPSAKTMVIDRERPKQSTDGNIESELRTWPVQLSLVSPQAPYLKDAEILLVADCVPFAYADFHRKMLQGKPVLIGCPKLDNAGFYIEKLAEIIKNNSPISLTVVHMEVPCCGGLGQIAKSAKALARSSTPMQDITIGIDGTIKNAGLL